MELRSTSERYGAVAQGLHWVSALLILILIALGLTMTRLGGGDNDTMYRVHVGLGLIVGVLTIVRVVWRFLEPSPPTPPMPEWRRLAYLGIHYALYVGLLALAGTGITTLLASGLTPFPTEVTAAAVEDGRPRDAHFVLALAYSGLLVLHVVGVMTYQRSKGDVTSRMGLNLPAPTKPNG